MRTSALCLLAVCGCGKTPAEVYWCDGSVVGDVGEVTVEGFTDRSAWEARLAGHCLSQVDFDDIETSGSTPVPFETDHYLELGIRIEGTKGQFVSRDFGLPSDFSDPPSRPNLYAPGPMEGDPDHPEGGFETDVTFEIGGKEAGVAAFGAMFVDADNPDRGPSGLAAYTRSGETVWEDTEVSGGAREGVFAGFVVTDATGALAPAVTRVYLVNGAEWVGANNTEDVALDDFRYLDPLPLD